MLFDIVGIDINGLTGGIYTITGIEVPGNSLVAPVSAPLPVHSLAAAGDAFGETS